MASRNWRKIGWLRVWRRWKRWPKASHSWEGERRPWRRGCQGRSGEMHRLDEEGMESERRAWRWGDLGRCTFSMRRSRPRTVR